MYYTVLCVIGGTSLDIAYIVSMICFPFDKGRELHPRAHIMIIQTVQLESHLLKWYTLTSRLIGVDPTIGLNMITATTATMSCKSQSCFPCAYIPIKMKPKNLWISYTTGGDVIKDELSRLLSSCGSYDGVPAIHLQRAKHITYSLGVGISSRQS